MEMASFTALNGGSPKAVEGMNGSAPEGVRTSRQSPSAEPRSAEGYQSQRDRESRDVQEAREVQERRSSTNHERPSFPGAATFADTEGSHKRKRSISDSPRRDRLLSPPSKTDRLERPERTERSEQYAPHRYHSESRDGRTTPQRDVYRGERGDEARDGEHWRSRESRDERTSSYEAPYSAGPVSAQSEEPVGDMLRRATSHGDEDQSPDGDDRAMYGGQYTPERRDGVVQSDPKKRKRNFSNRTKTGCLTCRKRKKKCDEKKPECEFESRHNILVSPRGLPRRACLHAWPHLRPHMTCSGG
jgi:hypothetical protein